MGNKKLKITKGMVKIFQELPIAILVQNYPFGINLTLEAAKIEIL